MKFKYGEKVILDDFAVVKIIGFRDGDNWYKIEFPDGAYHFVSEIRLRKKETFLDKLILFFKKK